MQFTTKDLMISVVPEAVADVAKLCTFRSHICFYPTFCRHHFSPVLCNIYSPCRFFSPCHFYTPCHFHTITYCQFPISQCHLSGCGLNYSTILLCEHGSRPFEFDDPLVIRTADELGALREELQATMKQLDEYAEGGLPGAGGVEDLKNLEARLKDAVKEVQKEIKERG